MLIQRRFRGSGSPPVAVYEIGSRIRMVLRPALLILCLFLAVSACAQDAASALRLSVSYGTLKNTATVSAETRAEADRFEKLAREAGAAAKYAEAMKHLYHAMAVIRGEEWTPLRALSSSLTVKLDRALLEPDQKFEVRLGEIFALDEKPQGKLTAAISLLTVPAEETAKPVETLLKTVDSLDPDWAATPLAIPLAAPKLEDGNYRLAVTLKAAAANENDPPVRKLAPVRIESGLAARVAAAKARVAKIEAQLKAGKKENLLPELPSAEYRLALYDLAAAGEIDFTRISFDEEFKAAAATLDDLEAGRDPQAKWRGDFRLAYRSKVDNTLQPYRIFVPSGYDGSKPYPLVIALHGMGGNENGYFDGYNNGSFKIEPERRGYIVACPKGRNSASMYTGTAEQDVMDVIAEVRRAYRIDPGRIYMTGHSMGGFGTWSVAINHPEVFAAIAPISGGGNPASVTKIATIPMLVVHGDNDKTVPVERSRVMVEAAKKDGAEVKYIEVPGGSHVGVAAPTFKNVFDWFDAHRKEQKAEGSKQ